MTEFSYLGLPLHCGLAGAVGRAFTPAIVCKAVSRKARTEERHRRIRRKVGPPEPLPPQQPSPLCADLTHFNPAAERHS